MAQTEYTSNLKAINPSYDEDAIDLKKIIFRLLHNWYWFLLAIVLALSAAFLYNRYTTRVYEIDSSLLVEEENISSPLGGGRSDEQGGLFQGLGIMNSMRNIYNQMVILSSSPIVAKTLEQLEFEVSYYSVGRVMVSEQYDQVPFEVIWDTGHPQITGADFNLTILPQGNLLLEIDGEDLKIHDYQQGKDIREISDYSYSGELNSGEKISTDEFAFTIILNDQFDPDSPNNYRFRFHNIEALVKRYKNNLTVSLQDDETSILHLTLRDFNVRKGEDFINKLIEVYQLDNLDKKNENANRTIQFINSQLETISDSLNLSETRMEDFQSSNQVLNISMQSQQLLERMKELDQEREELETKNKYYHYLNNYIQSNQELETVIAPSAMGIEDPLLNSLILQLNELITEKSSQTSIRKNSQHPTVLRLNAQIESVKSSLLENTNNIIGQSDIALNNLNDRIERFEAQVRRLPATERDYVNIEREYRLNNETYTFLLQKLS
ncbi:MAG: GumC family protein, partial [bacterium]